MEQHRRYIYTREEELKYNKALLGMKFGWHANIDIQMIFHVCAMITYPKPQYLLVSTTPKPEHIFAATLVPHLSANI